MRDKVIVTLLVGERIQRLWTDYMERGWKLYAQKHGYDILIFDRFLDDGPLGQSRTPHWQKLMAMSQPELDNYRQAVWIDADICINHFAAPCIAGAMTTDKVGCVVRKTGEEAREVYRAYGIDGRAAATTNTGVFVIRPALHARVMREVYETYRENAASAMENVPLSFHLFEHNLVEPIDPRFNVDWTMEIMDKYPFLTNVANPHTKILKPYCLHVSWAKSYFLHFINQAFTFDNGMPPYETRYDVAALYQDRLVPAELVVK